MVKNRSGQSGDGTFNSIESEELSDEISKLIFCMLMHDHKNDQKCFGWV